MAVRETALDVVIVGAGFGGLYALHRLRGLGLKAKALEAGAGVGGTWFWNRYPGARCDVESLDYCYRFSPELDQDWTWSERYAPQAEILAYLEHVADRFDLRRDIELGTRVASARYDEATARWRVRSEDGRRWSARFLVMATGCLSRPNKPQLEGLERFEGRVLYTAEWPHEGVDFTGQRVGVIGTGSSAVQSIPVIAGQAAQLTVFQRTPTYSVPANNRPLDPEEVARVKADWDGFRAEAAVFSAHFDASDQAALTASEEERRQVFDQRWDRGGLNFMFSFSDLLTEPEANATAAGYIRSRISEIVADPEVAERLSPQHTFACKRLCVDSGYYAAFNRPNVRLVDLRETPIEEVTARGLRTSKGEIELDALVFATGFDAMTGALNAIDIKGRDGLRLKDAWAAGPRTYLGLAVAGFPNLFLITGPGSPSVLCNMVFCIEQHVDWIAGCIESLRAQGIAALEAAPEAQDAWVEEVNAIAGGTIFPTCNSWYVGANVPGKPRVFMPYAGPIPAYRERCDQVAEAGYEGFRLTPATA